MSGRLHPSIPRGIRKDAHELVIELPSLLTIYDDPGEAEYEAWEALKEPEAILHSIAPGSRRADDLIEASSDFIAVLRRVQRHLQNGGVSRRLLRKCRESAVIYVVMRDRFESMKTEDARREGGKITASKRKAENATRHSEIRDHHKKLLAKYPKHEAIGRLKLATGLSASQIRKIVSQ